MTLSTLDPKPALVVVDLQKGIVGYPTIHPMADILARAAALAAAFRGAGFPVVLVNATGGAHGRTEAVRRERPAPAADFADFADELDQQDSDHVVTKKTWGAFHGTSLDEYLRAQGVTQLFLAGVATSAGVESTARAAHEHGYHVVLVTDAMTDMVIVNHQHSVDHVFPRIGETTDTAATLTLVQSVGRASDPS